MLDFWIQGVYIMNQDKDSSFKNGKESLTLTLNRKNG